MQVIPYVFIDTCVLKNGAFNFDSEKIKLFMDVIKSHSIRLLMPEIVASEIKRHMEILTDEASLALSSLSKLNKAPFLRDSPDWPLSEVARQVVEERFKLDSRLRGHALERFERFLADSNSVLLENKTASLSVILGDYFSYRAPFSRDKPKEFPDAIALSCLEAFASSKRAPVAIISSDKGFLEACGRSSYLIGFESIDDAMERIVNDPEEVERVKAVIHSEPKKLANLGLRWFLLDLYHRDYDLGALPQGAINRDAISVGNISVIAATDPIYVVTADLNVPYSFRVPFGKKQGFLLRGRLDSPRGIVQSGEFEGIATGKLIAKIKLDPSGSYKVMSKDFESWLLPISGDPSNVIIENMNTD